MKKLSKNVSFSLSTMLLFWSELLYLHVSGTPINLIHKRQTQTTTVYKKAAFFVHLGLFFASKTILRDTE